MTASPGALGKAEVRPCVALPGQVGLYATADIPAGEEVLTIQEPLLLVVDSEHLDETCNACLAWTTSTRRGFTAASDDEVTLKTCLGCHTVRYCDKKCQASAWKRYHKWECKLFNHLQPNTPPTTIRGLIRLLLLREHHALSDQDWKAFIRLPSHQKSFRQAGGEPWEGIRYLSKQAEIFSQTNLGEETVQDLHCRILVNSLTLMTPTLDDLGICVDPIASSINHSCAPNVLFTFDGPRCSFRSRRAIAKDEELFINYIDPNDPFRRRQQALSDRYFFTCQCTKCLKGPTLREDRYLRNDMDPAEVERLEGRMFAMVDAKHMLKKMVALPKAMKTIKESGLFPLDRQPWPSIRIELALAYLDEGQWVQALKHLLCLHFFIDPIIDPEPWYPVRLVRTWTITNLIFYLADLWIMEPDQVKELEGYQLNFGKIMWGLIHQVEMNVSKSHGIGSRFSVAVKRKADEFRADIKGNESRLGNWGDPKWLDDEWRKLRAIAETADG
ncbi:MAG: hypothetical protein M1823_004064 [Watsoniomyces obsoletus]|nr:MAG: hypothetical protein M1823_004064 [Watsoniomyces obsoletus]